MRGKKAKRQDIVKLVRPSVRALTAYHVDETPVRIKLDAMENPFLLPLAVKREIAEAARNARINLYPDPSACRLKQAIADLWGLDPERMVLGNGSDELIQAIILAFGGPVAFPVPTFAMYDITARALSQRVVTAPLGSDFSLDAGRLIRAVKRSRARVVFLASPNNPTGNRFSDDAVLQVLEEVKAAVVVDEAYFSFSGITWARDLSRFPNLIVLRTLSKIGFAGLRIGVLAASRAVTSELEKVRLPYNLNLLSQAAAVAALRHRSVIAGQISLLISERERLYNGLSRVDGITPFPSETNFILMRTRRSTAGVHAALKRAGILVKNLHRPGPLRNCLRVTVGTPRENDEFLRTLKRIMSRR